MTRTRAWIDLASPSHPFFFRALVDAIPEFEYRTTVRDKTETVDLTAEVGFEYSVIGRDFDNPTVRKLGIPIRTIQLALSAPAAEVSLSSRNAMCILASKARRIPSIHFTDNDITAHVDGLPTEKLYNRLEAKATHNVVPSAFQIGELTRWGTDSNRIHTYDGYKEDVYVADFDPDPNFVDRFPFDEFVVVRPEALDAAYVDAETSIVPALLSEIVDSGRSVVYLPRGRGDEAYAQEYEREEVYVPDQALNGLQLTWHATCILTGSGTMAREAAAMDKPAISFFPNQLLSVDQELVRADRIMHSRDLVEIREYIESLSTKEVSPDQSRAQSVRDEVASIVSELIEQVTGNE